MKVYNFPGNTGWNYILIKKEGTQQENVKATSSTHLSLVTRQPSEIFLKNEQLHIPLLHT